MTWNCEACTFANHPDDVACAICSTAGLWDCPVCRTEGNLPHQIHCHDCHYPRPGRAWACSGCRRSMPLTSPICTHCHRGFQPGQAWACFSCTWAMPLTSPRCTHCPRGFQPGQAWACSSCNHAMPLTSARCTNCPRGFQPGQAWGCPHCNHAMPLTSPQCTNCHRAYQTAIHCRRCNHLGQFVRCEEEDCGHCHCIDEVCPSNGIQVMEDIHQMVTDGRVAHFNPAYFRYITSIRDLARTQVEIDALDELLFTVNIAVNAWERAEHQRRIGAQQHATDQESIRLTGLPVGYSFVAAPDPDATCSLCCYQVGNCVRCDQRPCACCTECMNEPDNCDCDDVEFDPCSLCFQEECDPSCFGPYFGHTLQQSTQCEPSCTSSSCTMPMQLPVLVATHNVNSPGACVFHQQCIIQLATSSAGGTRCPNCRA
jgi:hypothetical protein